jgi:hypothetical protein
MAPGEFRDYNVEVGRHTPPDHDALGDFMRRFAKISIPTPVFPPPSGSLRLRRRTTGWPGFTRSAMATGVWHGCNHKA